MPHKIITAITLALTLMLSGCNNGDSGISSGSGTSTQPKPTVPTTPAPGPELEKTITKLSISPENATITIGQKIELVVTATFSDGSEEVVTDTPSLNWSSSYEDIAAIDNTGSAEGLSNGDVTITIATADGVSATSRLTVISTKVVAWGPAMLGGGYFLSCCRPRP